jgi:hypothetical protein
VAAPASELAAEIAHVRDLGLAGLRARWHSVFRRKAPDHLPRAKGLSKASRDRRERQQTLAAISSGDIRSLLNIEAMVAVWQTSFSALAPWSSYIAAR